MANSQLQTLFTDSQQDGYQSQGLTAAYVYLGLGVPSVSGYAYLIGNNDATDFGSGAGGPVFNQENVYINSFVNLITGNTTAAANFANTLGGATTLTAALTAVYNSMVPTADQTVAGRTFFLSEASYYAARAAQVGLTSIVGEAAVAAGSLANILVTNNVPGLGQEINQFLSAVANGSAVVPQTGDFTPILTAIGPQPGQTLTLTASVDAPGTGAFAALPQGIASFTTVVGTFGGTNPTFSPGDNITAQAGTSNTVLTLADQGTASVGNANVPATTVSGILTANIVSGEGITVNSTAWSGLTALNITASNGTDTVTVGDNTALVVNDNADDDVYTYGGSTVTVNNNPTPGSYGNYVEVHGGAATTSVSINGGYDEENYIYDLNSGSGTANTITTVSISGEVDYDTYIYSDALRQLNLTGITYHYVYVDAAAGTRTLNVALTNDGNAPGYASDYWYLQDDTATTISVSATVVASKNFYLYAPSATSLVFNDAVGLSFYDGTIGGSGYLDAQAAKSVTISGAGDFTADFSNVNASAVIDASASTGVVTVELAGGQSFTGGSGNDVVTLDGAHSAPINLGAGNNSLLAGSGGSIVAGVTIDGGVGGTNTISASLINAGTAPGIKDFQILDVSGFGSVLDTALLGSGTVAGIAISTADTAGTATLLNLASAVTVTDSVDGPLNALTITHASGSGTTTFNFVDNAGAAAHIDGFLLFQSTGDTGITVNSGGTVTTGSIANGFAQINETDNHLTTVTITGATPFFLGGISTDTGLADNAVATTIASSLTTIDGSSATGALSIGAGANFTESTHNTITYTGLAIEGGVGGDNITNFADSGVITEGATSALHVNLDTVTGKGAIINDQSSAGVDLLNLNGVSDTANVGSGTGVTVTVATATTLNDHMSVNFGTGTATVNDALTYNEAASVADGNITTLGGTLHGNAVSFGALANVAGVLGGVTSVAPATTFEQAVSLAESGTANTATWFQYGGNTYIENSGAAAGTADNIVVKLAGVVDLSHAAVAGTHITFA